MKNITKDSVVPVVTVSHHEKIKAWRLKNLKKGSKCDESHIPSLQRMFKDSVET